MDAGGFSIDQLMELAGLSVSQAGNDYHVDPFTVCRTPLTNWLLTIVYRVHPPEKGKNILVGCGPGNNGRDKTVFLIFIFVLVKYAQEAMALLLLAI